MVSNLIIQLNTTNNFIEAKKWATHLYSAPVFNKLPLNRTALSTLQPAKHLNRSKESIITTTPSNKQPYYEKLKHYKFILLGLIVLLGCEKKEGSLNERKTSKQKLRSMTPYQGYSRK